MASEEPVVLPSGDGQRATLYDPNRMSFTSLPPHIAERARRFAEAGHGGAELTDEERREWQELTRVITTPSFPVPADNASTQISQLVIANTYHCNMGCTYCYNELDTKEMKGSEVPGGMSWETAKTSIDQVLDQADPTRPVRIFFVGGEPLLEREILERSVEYAEANAAARGLKVQFNVYTNGTLLTARTLQWCEAHAISLVVSLDGPPALNSDRVLLSGRPTSRIVLRNIRRMIETRTSPMRRVRAVSQPGTPLLALHKYLVALGFNEVHVQPMYNNEGISSSSESEMIDLLEWWTDNLENGMVLDIMPFGSFFQKILHQGRAVSSWYPCQAARNAVTVGPDGRVYSCHHAIEEPTFEMGNITRGLPIVEVRSRHFKRVDEREPCRSCWARHICGGECYHRSFSAGAGEFGTLPNTCRERKALIGFTLDAFARVAKRNPQALKRLALGQLSLPMPQDLAYQASDLRDFV
ncbi:SPASM domain-containing protein [Kitasatospora sp. RB6PN24]|uniref:radical SAM/SPASM domain-containing protein n=1 Tax=Kitasatospora humi TaxID=2893891 RepID=UPI001E5FEAB4|nr:radical SAM protein [Kitasatospora humi]MCC9309749.1 SPASM domain-containing protein [Kitasatospora humi]